MKNTRKSIFSPLNPEAKLFRELANQMPNWWNLLINDEELYIDVRKDNSINVYYYGGSIAQIQFKSDFIAKTHQKYLGDFEPRGKTKKGNDKFEYDKIDLSFFTKNKVEEIKKRIKETYLRRIDSERPAEKWIQGKLVIENSNYIDSEFQFNKNLDIGKLRIDLIELKSNKLSFIELKGITDSRLRNDQNRNSNIPEIIEQMEKYNLFIKSYETELQDYYKNLLEIKQHLKLTTISDSKFSINLKPKLIIVNTYQKDTAKRKERVSDIENLLENNNIDYIIVK